MRRHAIALGLGMLSIASCNGTETGNPPLVLDSFDTTGCKSKENHASIKLPSIALKSVTKSDRQISEAAANEIRYSGRTCFVWERADEETLEIALTNYAAGCGSSKVWEPEVELADDGSLNLRMENPSCSGASCGWCLYDLAFSVRLRDMPDELAVKLLGSRCSGEAPLQHQTTLKLSGESPGESCEYANKYALAERCPTLSDDFLYKPCGEPGSLCGAPVTCPDGTQCSEVAEGDARCVPSCTSNADCAPYADTHCKEQLCLL